jgi:hypothetical protein
MNSSDITSFFRRLSDYIAPIGALLLALPVILFIFPFGAAAICVSIGGVMGSIQVGAMADTDKSRRLWRIVLFWPAGLLLAAITLTVSAVFLVWQWGLLKWLWKLLSISID